MAAGLTNDSLQLALAQYGVSVRTITFDGKHHPPMIFDSSEPTGNDMHLGTRNEACPGCTPDTCPGLGSGGAPFQPGENCDPLYQCLIISEDCDSNDPDDNAGPGTVLLEACTGFYAMGFTFINAPPGSYLKFYDIAGNQCPYVYPLPIPTHHVNARVDVGPVTVFNTMTGPFQMPVDDYTKAHCSGYQVTRVAIHLAGSGCIDNVLLRFPAVSNSECLDNCGSTCCDEESITCIEASDTCDGKMYPGPCDSSDDVNECEQVCCVDNDRGHNIMGTLVPRLACLLPSKVALPVADCQGPITLGACCARVDGSGVCYDAITHQQCISYDGEWFPRLYCGDPEVDQCRLGQCCEVASNDELDRKRNLHKRACRKRGGIECPCEDVTCPAGFDTELPCSREGVCKKKSGWGWYTQYECRFGTKYGDVCGTGSTCTAEGDDCECTDCRCSIDNTGATSELCTTPTTSGPTEPPAPTCPPASNACYPNKYRRECNDGHTEFMVFTPYPPETQDTTVCSPLAPCYMPCCGTECRISATYLKVEGGTLFRYFVKDCAAEYISVPYCVNGDLSALKCKFIAPFGPLFELSSAGSALDGSSSSSSSSSSLSSVGDDASAYSTASETSVKHECSLLVSCGDGLGIPIHSGYHGVEVFIPGAATVTTAPISLVVGGDCVTCGIEGPIASCSSPTSLAFDQPVHRALGRTNNVCREPPMPLHSMPEEQQRAAALAWADFADEKMSALLDCVRKPFTDTAPVKVYVPTDGSCDYNLCVTRIGADKSRRTLAKTVIETMLDGDRQMSFGRYNDATQAYCCAEFIVDRLADVWKCDSDTMASRCGTKVIHPIGSPARGRPTLEDIDAVRRVDDSARPISSVLAFQQCRLNALTVEDNSVNSGIFEVSATSHVNGDQLLDYTMIVRPLAFGSTDDAALDVRFSDVNIPAGSRVYLTVVGTDPFTVCYTANSVGDATAECPSMSYARLFRSVRNSFEQSSLGDRAPLRINTIANMPRVNARQIAVVTVFPPLGTHANAAANIQLDFEMVFRDDDSTCVTRTNGNVKGSSGFGVIVPAPFRWTRANVPTFFEDDSPGMCIGGDDAGQPCKEKQECPRGYCDTKQNHCVDTVAPGVNAGTICTRKTQCNYGICDGYKGSGRRGAYPLLKEWLECAAIGCYSMSKAHSPWCMQGNCFTTALNWSQYPDQKYANDLYTQE